MDMSKPRQYLCALLLLLAANANGHDIPKQTVAKDDSETIVSRLRDSMQREGLISVEQHNGRLLFNPPIEKLQQMPLKQKFLVPAMIVNQTNGLHIISELPFNCFLISGEELTGEQYKGFKQYEIARYLRDVKAKPTARALICQAVGLTGAREWGKSLALNLDGEQFVFSEHTSVKGDKFYYYLNSDGLFEMYL